MDGRLAVLAIVAALAGKQNGDDTFALPLLVHVHLTLHGRCNGGGGHSLVQGKMVRAPGMRTYLATLYATVQP